MNDSNDLANKLDFAKENFKAMNEIIERGYQDACGEFSLDKMINETISFYKEILR